MGLHKKYLKKQLQNSKFKEFFDVERELADLAVKIQNLRIKKGISQAELAQMAHLTQQQVSAIEHGTNFTLKTLLQIGKVLDLKIKLSA